MLQIVCIEEHNGNVLLKSGVDILRQSARCMEAGGGRQQQAGGASILNFRLGANAERPYVDRGPPALFWATSQTHTHPQSDGGDSDDHE